MNLRTMLLQIEKQQLANPKKEGEEPYKPLAPVLENSVVWGGFMGLSTNLRYQLLNGFEERLLVTHHLIVTLKPIPPLLSNIFALLKHLPTRNTPQEVDVESASWYSSNSAGYSKVIVFFCGAGIPGAKRTSKSSHHLRFALQQYICRRSPVGLVRPSSHNLA